MKMIKNRRRLAASSSSWTALMRSQGLPPSPGALSIAPPLSLEFHFSHPQLEPKVQQRRHPYSPPADSGKMEHNLKHDNNFHQYDHCSGNLGWPISSRSSCHCDKQTAHSDLPSGGQLFSWQCPNSFWQSFLPNIRFCILPCKCGGYRHWTMEWAPKGPRLQI